MLTNMVGALNNALDLMLKENDKLVVFGEDVGKDGGVFRVTDGLQAKYGDGRVFDSPLAESGIAGAAIGMAIGGMHPVAEMQFAGFMFLGFSQMVNHAARYRTRTRGNVTLPLMIRTPVSGGVKTLEHHSESPEIYWSHMGGIVVIEPSNPYDAKGLMIKALRMTDPVVFLEPTKLYRLFKQNIPDEAYEVPVGKAAVMQEGTQLTIVTYGTMAPLVKDVVAKKKTDAEIIDLRTINPIDEATIIASAKKTGRVLIVHEASMSFGVGAEVAARVAEKAIFELDAPIMRVAGPSLPYPFPAYEKYWVPNATRISQAIDKILQE